MEFPNKNLEKKNAIWLFTKAKKCSYGSIERILLVLERSAKVVANHSLSRTEDNIFCCQRIFPEPRRPAKNIFRPNKSRESWIFHERLSDNNYP